MISMHLDFATNNICDNFHVSQPKYQMHSCFPLHKGNNWKNLDKCLASKSNCDNYQFSR